MRWASPPERVAMARPKERYSRPTLRMKDRRWVSSLSRGSATRAWRPSKCRPSSHCRARSTEREQNWAMFRSSTRTARASGLRRAPWQSGQSVDWRKRAKISRQASPYCMPFSSSGMTPGQRSSLTFTSAARPAKSSLW